MLHIIRSETVPKAFRNVVICKVPILGNRILTVTSVDKILDTTGVSGSSRSVWDLLIYISAAKILNFIHAIIICANSVNTMISFSIFILRK